MSAVEFEYTCPPGATEWMGEPPGGKRGQNRTSADAALWWRDREARRRLTLVEWKYTESEFGSCGGHRSRGNQQRLRCDELDVGVAQPRSDCYIASGKDHQTSRRYWDHLAEAGISLEPFSRQPGCPFRGPFYQLLRLALLAAYCEEATGDVDIVDVIVMGFRDNLELLTTPAPLRYLGQNVLDAWNRLAPARPIRWLTVQELLAGSGVGPHEWREYVAGRYGV